MKKESTKRRIGYESSLKYRKKEFFIEMEGLSKKLCNSTSK